MKADPAPAPAGRRWVVCRPALLGPAAVPGTLFLRPVADGRADWSPHAAAAEPYESFEAAARSVLANGVAAAWPIEVRIAGGPAGGSAEERRGAAVEVLTSAEYADRRAWSLRRLAREVLRCDPSWLSRLARELAGAAPDPAKAKAARAANGRRRPG